jgi:hypothetical protein
MKIPRKPEAEENLHLEINIRKTLRPYLEDYYAENKQPGETIEDIVQRIVRDVVLLAHSEPTRMTMRDLRLAFEEQDEAEFYEDRETIKNEV